MTSAVRRLQQWLLLITGVIAVGCSSDDQRLVDMSRQSLDRQAEQNRLVETNNQQVIDATKTLVEADARARRENGQLHQKIQSERSEINQQRDHLEHERREIAQQRHRDPIVAESIQSGVGLIVAALPLLVCLFLLRGLFQKSDDEALADLLVEELVTRQPFLAESEAAFLSADSPNGVLSPPSETTRKGLSVDDQVPATARPDVGRGQIIVHVEGANDIEFLRRISRMLHQHNAEIPDLHRLEAEGRLAFLTSSSSGLTSTAVALPPSVCEFCLYDREMSAVTEERRRLVDLLNQRPHCQAVLTTKRAIENYLHPNAVGEAGAIEVSYGDFDDVAEVVARAAFQQRDGRSWESLSRRARRRLREKSKKWLNREAVDRMTPERLVERDPAGEIVGWLRTIAELAGAGARAPA